MTDQFQERLLQLLEQARSDRASLQLPDQEAGREIYTRLIDSLTATMHNLTDSSAVEQRGD